MSKPELKVLSVSSYNLATPGKFRVVLWVESEPYQVGEEVDSLDDAREVKRATEPFKVSPSFPPTIYNANGEEME